MTMFLTRIEDGSSPQTFEIDGHTFDRNRRIVKVKPVAWRFLPTLGTKFDRAPSKLCRRGVAVITETREDSVRIALEIALESAWGEALPSG